MNIFLYDPQDFSNVCTISRTLEFFWVKDCYVYDNHNLIREKYWKSYSRRLKTQSSWAFEKINFHKIEDYISFLKKYNWTKIITLLDEKADSLENYKPLENDIIIFGNEGIGLPEEIISLADEKIYIKRIWKTQSLNLSNTVAIVVYNVINNKWENIL